MKKIEELESSNKKLFEDNTKLREKVKELETKLCDTVDPCDSGK